MEPTARTDQQAVGFQASYESALWGVMDRLGITESVERKMVTAVVLQFLATLAVFALPLVFLGPQRAISVFPTAQIVLTAVVFGLSILALLNTYLIARKDVIIPIETLESIAGRVAEGDLEQEPPATDQPDEIGDLTRSFRTMHEYLQTVAAQADALAHEEFDAPVLTAEVPGAFGRSLTEMQHGLETRITDLESSQARITRQREVVEQRKQALEDDADRIAAVMRRCAAGDFTQRVTIESDHEAMSEIATAVNAMLDDVEATLTEVTALATEVDRVGSEVSRTVAELENASGEVSASADEISVATADQNDRFADVLGEMSSLSATIQEIASTADGVASRSEQAATRAREGRETAGEAITALEQIEDRSAAIVGQIEALEADLTEVTDVVELIDDIAEETNLLAINASIEAAHAGTDGQSFAVVADEIKSLSEETSEATTRVEKNVSRIQSSADEAVTEIANLQRDVETGADTIEASLTALTEIADVVQEANDGVQSINDATDEQAYTSQEVVRMVDEATERSEDTLQETNSVAAAAEEQTATIATIADAAEGLSETATRLTDHLAAFDLAEDYDGTHSLPTTPQ